MKKFIFLILFLAFCSDDTVETNSIEVREEIVTTTTEPISSQSIFDKYPISSQINCSTFETKDELNEWWDKSFIIYGDVAELDLNFDNIPCNGSTNQSLYSEKRETDPLVLELTSNEEYVTEAVEWCLSDPYLNRENVPELGTPERDVWIDAKISRQVGEQAYKLIGNRWPEYLYNVLTSNREAFSSREFAYQLYFYWILGDEGYSDLVPSIWSVVEAEYYGKSLYIESCLLAYNYKDEWFDRHEGWYEFNP